MKKAIHLLLAASVAALFLVSCGGSGSSSSGKKASVNLDGYLNSLAQLRNVYTLCTGGYDSGNLINMTQSFYDTYQGLDAEVRELLDGHIAKYAADEPEFGDYLAAAGLIESQEAIDDMAYRYFKDLDEAKKACDYNRQPELERCIKKLKLALSKEEREVFQQGRDRYFNDNPDAKRRFIYSDL